MGAAAELDQARTYDAWYATPLGAAANRIELRLIADLAAPKYGARVLDVGCAARLDRELAPYLEFVAVSREPA